MSAASNTTYTHDAVGNRVTKVTSAGSTLYGWDEVNRMIESGPTPGAKNQYKYRADGMRVKKTLTSGSESVFYDGQMPVETFWDESGTSNDVLTRNLVAKRGIEMLEKTDNSGTVVSYPLYDTHGNMIATVTKNSGGTAWNIGDERNYDVWGGVRQGNATGGPKGRHCANIGHVQDDESGLVYMRARYYEPESGRFISEDKAMDGLNWYVYADSNPTNYIDISGRSSLKLALANGFWAFVELVGNIMGVDLPKIPHMMIEVISSFFAILENWKEGDKYITGGQRVMAMSRGVGGAFGAGIFTAGLGFAVAGALMKLTAIFQFANLMFKLHLIAIDEDQPSWGF